MHLIRWIALPCLMIALAACQSAQERAEAFFESGLELRAEGDLPRAALEFLNVFRYDGAHRAARVNLAEIRLEQGDPTAAFSQYLRLAEYYPDDPEIRIALSEIAVTQQSWAMLRRHGEMAIQQAPERPESRAIAAMIDYMDATDDDDPEVRADAVTRADALLAESPDNHIARRLAVIIGRLSENELEPALVALDDAIGRAPDDLTLNTLKLQVLNALERPEEVETLLLDLYDRFPENTEIAAQLVQWYRQREDLAGVETLMRDRAGAPNGPTEGHMPLIQFLNQTKGADAARTEVTGLIAANAGNAASVDAYVRADAALAFDQGNPDEAIDLLRGRLDDDTVTEETPELQTILAQMLLATGDPVGARALVEDVLGTDPGNVEALKMQASWLIDADKSTQAIAALRTALDQEPNDAAILTLMARAHERDGDRQLAGERLALAMEMSGDGVAESLRYARFLADDDRLRSAGTVIEEALRAAPGNVDLLTEQARLALTRGDTAVSRTAIAALEALGDDPVAADRATALRAALLLGQERFDEGLALLEDRAEGEDASSEFALDVVRTRLRAGQVEEAQAYLDARLAERPEDPTLRFARAVLRIAIGQPEGAEPELRALIEEFPLVEAPVRQLYVLLTNAGREEEAAAVLDAALERAPDTRNLLLLRAGRLEASGDLEAALDVYAGLYDLDGGDLIVANNYASLLSELNDDIGSLERAGAVARRLGDSDVPDFQDTYGWIAYRLGDFEEALTYLEPAAAGRPENPVIAYHLGMTYIALERPEDARAALSRAIQLGQGRIVPQLEAAQRALDAL